MLTLHKTSELVKKGLKITAALSAAFVTLIILIRIGGVIKNTFFPTPPPQPDATFGKLPKIPFPRTIFQDTYAYTIDTLTGTLPSFSDRVKVFMLEQPALTLLNSEKAEAKAVQLRFVDRNGNVLPYRTLSSTTYQWDNVYRDLPRALKIDIQTFNFELTSQYLTHPAVIKPTFRSNEERAKTLVMDLLTNVAADTSDLDKEKTKTQLLSIKNGVLIPAASLATTNLIKVDHFQNDVEELPIYYPRHPNSMMTFLIAIEAFDVGSVVEAKYYHQKIATNSATYAIKTADEAFEELKSGKGYIANYFGSDINIRITDVSLGYYLGEVTQQYLMPIIVFKGEHDFYAYVSAVKDTWIE